MRDVWKVLFFYLVFLVLVVAVLGQDGPRKPPTEASTEFQSKILKLQLRQSIINNQVVDCQEKFKTLPDEFSRNYNAIQLLATQAVQDAKLDPKEWELNLDTLQFAKKPAPKPEADKPKQ
jgi:hypothetical protein